MVALVHEGADAGGERGAVCEVDVLVTGALVWNGARRGGRVTIAGLGRRRRRCGEEVVMRAFWWKVRVVVVFVDVRLLFEGRDGGGGGWLRKGRAEV